MVAERYAKYLNYLMRKNFVPIKVTPDIKLDFKEISTGASIVPGDWKPGTSTYESTIAPLKDNVEYTTTVSFHFSLTYWYFAGVDDLDTTTDAVYANTAQWSTSRTQQRSQPYGSKVHTAKIFFHLDKALKMLNTLSRKVNYGSAAFKFRTN